MGARHATQPRHRRNCDDENDPARQERFIVLCRSCAGARSSRHRSCGGGLSEEDEQPHVFHHDNVGTMAHIANKNPSATLRMAAATAATAQGFALLSPSRRAQWFTDSEVEEMLADHSTSPDACCYCIAPFEGGDQQECTYCRGFGHWSCGRVVIGGRGRPPGWRCWRCPTPEESSSSEEEECQLRDHTNPDEGEEKEEHQPRQQVQKSATEVVEWDCQHPHDGDPAGTRS